MSKRFPQTIVLSVVSCLVLCQPALVAALAREDPRAAQARRLEDARQRRGPSHRRRLSAGLGEDVRQGPPVLFRTWTRRFDLGQPRRPGDVPRSAEVGAGAHRRGRDSATLPRPAEVAPPTAACSDRHATSVASTIPAWTTSSWDRRAGCLPHLPGVHDLRHPRPRRAHLDARRTAQPPAAAPCNRSSASTSSTPPTSYSDGDERRNRSAVRCATSGRRDEWSWRRRCSIKM